MGFPRQEYWSGLSFPFPEDLPDSEIEPAFPILQADSLPAELLGKPTATRETIASYGKAIASIWKNHGFDYTSL